MVLVGERAAAPLALRQDRQPLQDGGRRLSGRLVQRATVSGPVRACATVGSGHRRQRSPPVPHVPSAPLARPGTRMLPCAGHANDTDVTSLSSQRHRCFIAAVRNGRAGPRPARLRGRPGLRARQESYATASNACSPTSRPHSGGRLPEAAGPGVLRRRRIPHPRRARGRTIIPGHTPTAERWHPLPAREGPPPASQPPRAAEANRLEHHGHPTSGPLPFYWGAGSRS